MSGPRGANATTAEGWRRIGTVQEDMEAFDRLPPSIRAAMATAPVSIAPVEVLEDYRMIAAVHGPRVATAAAMECIVETVHGELRAFGAQHAARYGRMLPHIAAGATPQPYARARRRR